MHVNDKDIGIQIGYSIYRVLTGYFLAALVAIPLGFLIGMLLDSIFGLLQRLVAYAE